MDFNQFLQEAGKLGVKPEMCFNLMRDFQLNTFRNLLVAKNVISNQEFDDMMTLEFKRMLEMFKKLQKDGNLPPSNNV